MTILFVLFFLCTEIVLSRYIITGPVVRFVLRVVFLTQYTLVIRFLFDHFDREDGESPSMKEPSGDSEVQDTMTEQSINHEENG